MGMKEWANPSQLLATRGYAASSVQNAIKIEIIVKLLQERESKGSVVGVN